jgi:hypothetical protein
LSFQAPFALPEKLHQRIQMVAVGSDFQKINPRRSSQAP